MRGYFLPVQVSESRTVGIAKAGGIFDGGFEGPINSSLNSQGFGWQPTQATQTVHMLVDPNEPQSGNDQYPAANMFFESLPDSRTRLVR